MVEGHGVYEASSVIAATAEEYTGPLAGTITKSIPDPGPSFRRFANGLRYRVEG